MPDNPPPDRIVILAQDLVDLTATLGGRAAEDPFHRGVHREIFEPMRQLFGMVREIATAITHEVGAFG